MGPVRVEVVDVDDTRTQHRRASRQVNDRDRVSGTRRAATTGFPAPTGQQSIYPGGFTLGVIGIGVRGRSTILSTNYRNTAEVLKAALALIV